MIDKAIARLAERNMTRHRIPTQTAAADPPPERPAVTSTPAAVPCIPDGSAQHAAADQPGATTADAATVDRHVIAISGPRSGQHGTTPADSLRRCALLTVPDFDSPSLVPAGCQVAWADGTNSGYPVAWLRAEPLAEPATR